MEITPASNLSPNHPPVNQSVEESTGLGESPAQAGSVLQRIGWRRPSAEERRWWLIQGAVIGAAVLALGTLMLLALR